MDITSLHSCLHCWCRDFASMSGTDQLSSTPAFDRSPCMLIQPISSVVSALDMQGKVHVAHASHGVGLFGGTSADYSGGLCLHAAMQQPCFVACQLQPMRASPPAGMPPSMIFLWSSTGQWLSFLEPAYLQGEKPDTVNNSNPVLYSPCNMPEGLLLVYEKTCSHDVSLVLQHALVEHCSLHTCKHSCCWCACCVAYVLLLWMTAGDEIMRRR